MATAIADWCEERAAALGRDAARQFRLIVGIVVVGLALLLVLPPLIGQIDFLTARLFGGAPPIEALENAERSVLQLDAQVQESRARLEELTSSQAEIEARLATSGEEGLIILKSARDLLAVPGATWRPLRVFESDNQEFFSSFESLLVTPQGDLFVAGSRPNGPREEMFILRSRDSGESWSKNLLVDSDGNGFRGKVNSLTATSDGGLFAAGRELGSEEVGLIFFHSNDGRKWVPLRPEGLTTEQLNGDVFTVISDRAGALVAVGHEAPTREPRMMILRSDDGRRWSSIGPEENSSGWLEVAVVAPDGALIVSGSVEEPEVDGIVFMRTQDGEAWSFVVPKDSKGDFLKGSGMALMVLPDDSLLAAGTASSGSPDEIAILRSEDGINWVHVRLDSPIEDAPTGGLRSLAVGPDGALYAGGFAGAGNDSPSVYLYRSTDGLTWQVTRPESYQGSKLAHWIGSLVAAPNGTLVAAGSLLWLVDLNPKLDARLDAIHTEQAPPDLVQRGLEYLINPSANKNDFGYPEGLADLREEARTVLDSLNLDQERHAEVSALQASQNEAVQKQEETLENFHEGTELLAKTLTDADDFRQASRIATRIAVVALLIYLVQIVVNRYRYLQRIAGFYQARAQAMRLMAASPAAAEAMLKDVSVTDLMLALSPDGIGFDKSADPPTQNMMNMFRESMRRGQ